SLDFLLVQSLLNFLRKAFVVQLEQASEDFTAGWFVDRVANALLRLVEAVAEVEIGPAIGGGYGLVHFDVELTEFLDVGARFIRIVESVASFGQTLLMQSHNLASLFVILFANLRNPGLARQRK